MALSSFQDLEEYVNARDVHVVIALAGANDNEAMDAVVKAYRLGLAEPILIGPSDEIESMLVDRGEKPASFRIIHETDEAAMARLAVERVRLGEADMPMKGLLHTSEFMHAILDSETGLKEKGQLLSQASLVEFSEQNRFIIASDCAVNIAPDVKGKVGIIENAVSLAQQIGIDDPRIALLSAVEVVNPKIPSTEDAVLIKEQLKDRFKIDGPLALDNAISVEAARHKGIDNDVAGRADILIVPDLWSGNIFSKSLVFFAHMQTAGVLLGLTSPVIMTSRTETPENKFNSILTCVFQALRMQELKE